VSKCKPSKKPAEVGSLLALFFDAGNGGDLSLQTSGSLKTICIKAQMTELFTDTAVSLYLRQMF
jgi:hypothetical protein